MTRKSSFFKNKKFIGLALLVVGVVSIIAFASSRSKASNNDQPLVNINRKNDSTKVNEPLAKVDVNQAFSFPLLDSNEVEISRLNYTVESAELRDQIIIKGQKADAVEGRKFLIITLKITNDFNQGLEVRSKDYIRLMLNGTQEKQAPTIHNDPVEVQAISTKQTRVGFSINDTDSNLVLQVGEIDGEKQFIPLEF